MFFLSEDKISLFVFEMTINFVQRKKVESS